MILQNMIIYMKNKYCQNQLLKTESKKIKSTGVCRRYIRVFLDRTYVF